MRIAQQPNRQRPYNTNGNTIDRQAIKIKYTVFCLKLKPGPSIITSHADFFTVPNGPSSPKLRPFMRPWNKAVEGSSSLQVSGVRVIGHPLTHDGQKAKCGGKRLISACRMSFRLQSAVCSSDFSLPYVVQTSDFSLPYVVQTSDFSLPYVVQTSVCRT
jgi:hypothetical protein